MILKLVTDGAPAQRAQARGQQHSKHDEYRGYPDRNWNCRFETSMAERRARSRGRPFRDGLHFIADGYRLDASNGARSQALHGTRPFENAEALRELPKQHA